MLRIKITPRPGMYAVIEHVVFIVSGAQGNFVYRLRVNFVPVAPDDVHLTKLLVSIKQALLIVFVVNALFNHNLLNSLTFFYFFYFRSLRAIYKSIV